MDAAAATPRRRAGWPRRSRYLTEPDPLPPPPVNEHVHGLVFAAATRAAAAQAFADVGHTEDQARRRAAAAAKAKVARAERERLEREAAATVEAATKIQARHRGKASRRLLQEPAAPQPPWPRSRGRAGSPQPPPPIGAEIRRVVFAAAHKAQLSTVTMAAGLAQAMARDHAARLAQHEQLSPERGVYMPGASPEPEPEEASGVEQTSGMVWKLRSRGKRMNGRGMLLGWRQYWCLVSDGWLQVYNGPTALKPKKTICLAPKGKHAAGFAIRCVNASSADESELFADVLETVPDPSVGSLGMIDSMGDNDDVPEQMFVFELKTKATGSYFFACETEVDMEAWMRCVTRQHQHYVDVGVGPKPKGKRNGWGRLRDVAEGRGDAKPAAVVDHHYPTGRDMFDEMGEGEEDWGQWNDMYQRLSYRPSVSSEQNLKAQSEFLGNFWKEVQSVTTTIVSEYFLPASLQSVPPCSTNDLDEHDYELGAAVMYFDNGILYRMVSLPAQDTCEDELPQSVAWKAASCELRGTKAYLQAALSLAGEERTVPRLRTSLTMLVDIHGFRIMATALLPVAQEETLVFGDGCESTDQRFVDLLNTSSKRMHLAPHPVQYSDEHAPAEISTSIDVQGHRGMDDRYYLVNLGRVLPPDLPREDSFDLLTHQLRPEFVRSCKSVLSPDAFSDVGDVDESVLEFLDTKVAKASQALQEDVIPQFVADLDSMRSLPCDGRSLVQQMHSAGINARYMGRMAELAEMPHVFDLLVVEMAARCSKHILFRRMRERVDRHRLEMAKQMSKRMAATNSDLDRMMRQDDLELWQFVTDFFNLMLGASKESDVFWETAISPGVADAYGFELDKLDVPMRPLLLALQDACGVEFTSSTSSPADHVRTHEHNITSFRDIGSGRLLMVSELQSFQCAVKQPLLDFSASLAPPLLTDEDTRRLYKLEASEASDLCGDSGADGQGDLAAAIQQALVEESEEVSPTLQAADDLAAISDVRALLRAAKESGCCSQTGLLKLTNELVLKYARFGHDSHALRRADDAMRLCNGLDCESAQLYAILVQLERRAGFTRRFECKQWCARGIAAVTWQWGSKHPMLLQFHSTLASLAEDERHPTEALEQYEHCRRISEAALGLSSVTTAFYYNAVGRLCRGKHFDRPHQAVACHERAVSIYETVLGRSHVATGKTCHELSSALLLLGDNVRAMQFAIQGCETSSELLGVRHPETVVSYTHIVAIAARQRDSVTARQYFRRVLEHHTHCTGVDQSILAVARMQLTLLPIDQVQMLKNRSFRKDSVANAAKLGKSHQQSAVYKSLATVVANLCTCHESTHYVRKLWQAVCSDRTNAQGSTADGRRSELECLAVLLEDSEVLDGFEAAILNPEKLLKKLTAAKKATFSAAR